MTTTNSAPVDDIGFVTEQIETEARANPAQERRQRRADTMRPLMWRLHFLGGFLAAPIIVSLALSGILFAWAPQVDGLRFGTILYQPSDQVAVSLADQVKAARAAHPDWGVYAVSPGTGGHTTAVLMDPPGGEAGFGGAPEDGINVYVDQISGRVTGDISGDETADSIFRTLHSSWRLGEKFEPFTELAGSLFFVSLLTGLYLWWPGLRKRGTIAFAARRGLTGRRRSKEWHNFIGVALFVPMIFLAFTGLAWTQFSSTRIGMVDKRLSPATGSAPSALPTPAPGQQDIGNIDKVWAQAQQAQLVAPVQIVVPTNDKTAWKAISGDLTFPVQRDQIAVNGATGEVTGRFDYSDEHWFNKLQTAGTLFHQAQLFGPPLQVFMSLLAASIIAMIYYGYKMWWQRRPAGGMGAPPPIRNWIRNAPVSILVATVVLAWLLPVLGLAFIVWLVIEAGWRWFEIARGRRPGPGAGADGEIAGLAGTGGAA
jgi:uncharacterized iron-regulated membrane protein